MYRQFGVYGPPRMCQHEPHARPCACFRFLQWEENIMRGIITFITLAAVCSIVIAVRAEQSGSCSKQCQDQRQACSKNYSAKTCGSEYNICIKACQKK
jgi:hypothetical protein